MHIGSNSLYDIGTNYFIKLNDEEVLVLEDDELREPKKKTEYEKLQAKEEQKAQEEKKDSSDELSTDEKRLINDLASRDAEVRAHESAHQSGGASTGAATFTYQQGPDGKMYAIGGEVSISMQSGSTPQETIANAQAVIASATAPADPSGQDMAVAASAAMIISKAQQQLAQEKQNEIEGKEIYKNEAIKEVHSESSSESSDITKMTI